MHHYGFEYWQLRRTLHKMICLVIAGWFIAGVSISIAAYLYWR